MSQDKFSKTVDCAFILKDGKCRLLDKHCGNVDAELCQRVLKDRLYRRIIGNALRNPKMKRGI